MRRILRRLSEVLIGHLEIVLAGDYPAVSYPHADHILRPFPDVLGFSGRPAFPETPLASTGLAGGANAGKIGTRGDLPPVQCFEDRLPFEMLTKTDPLQCHANTVAS